MGYEMGYLFIAFIGAVVFCVIVFTAIANRKEKERKLDEIIKEHERNKREEK